MPSTATKLTLVLTEATMTAESLISELWAYAQTKEYREGLFVEVSGLALDVLLLVAAVSLVAHYLSRDARRRTNFASSFFTAQFLRDTFALLLRAGGVTKLDDCLVEACQAGKMDSKFSHVYYGNTENLRDLLRVRMNSGRHIQGHQKLNAEDRKACAREADSLLKRLDNLLVLLASLRQDEQCLRAYEFRLVLTSFKDYLEALATSAGEPPPRTFAPLSTGLASATASWFSKCQYVLERQRKKAIRRSYAKLLLQLPQIVIHRIFIRAWRRITKTPYRDPVGSNFFSLFFDGLAEAFAFDWEEAIRASGVNRERLLLLWNQHANVSHDESISMLERLKPHFRPDIWNSVLAASVLADVDRRSINIVTTDAVKANAIYRLTRLAAKDDVTSDVIQRTFQSLWNLRPTTE